MEIQVSEQEMAGISLLFFGFVSMLEGQKLLGKSLQKQKKEKANETVLCGNCKAKLYEEQQLVSEPVD